MSNAEAGNAPNSSTVVEPSSEGSTAPEQKEKVHDVAEEGPPISKWRLIALSISLSLGLFVSFLDGSITATALFTIGEEFDDLSRINWIAIAYILADVGFAVTFTSVGDVVGRKNAYLTAFFLFFVFSLGCGFANTMTQLIVLRAFQGVGGAGLYALAMVIFPEISPRSMKKWIGAIVGLVVGVSGVSGPILGGIITRYANWRWIFWINGPICVVDIALFFIAWPRDDKIMMQHERRKWAELDYAGSFLLIAATVLIVFAFQETGTRIDWGDALFIGPLVAGIVCWILLLSWQFIIWKQRKNIAAVIPVDLFKNRRYMAGVFSTMFMGFAFFSCIYDIPLRVQTVHGRSSLAAGVALLPMLGSVAVGSMLGGAVSGTKDRLSHTLMIGAAFMSIGTGLLSTLEVTHSVSHKLYGFQVFCGMGFGLTVSSSSILAAIECEINSHAVAQGLTAQARVFGGSIGIAASTAILSVKENARRIRPGSESDLSSLALADLDNLRQAYGQAFHEVMWVSAIISAIAFGFAVLTYKKNLPELQDRVLEQMRVEAERRKGPAEPAAESTGSISDDADMEKSPQVNKSGELNREEPAPVA